MGKFESYPSTTSLSDDDITLFNQETLTHKITFSNLFTTIKNKLIQAGLISISTDAGLTGGTITSSGTIKCNLKSENLSLYQAVIPTDLANRRFAVGLDRDGKLSVVVPESSSSGMTTNGSNADSHVTFSGAFTVGSRANNSTVGTNSVAEGYDVEAIGNYSYAEGNSTVANGESSHAEGFNTYAAATCCHAEGNSTLAGGLYSHSEGDGSVARGDTSHASGTYTIANGMNQTVIGKYNVAQGHDSQITNTDYALIIGNGTSDDDRSDALAIKWDGTIIFANGTSLSPSEINQLKALIT